MIKYSLENPPEATDHQLQTRPGASRWKFKVFSKRGGDRMVIGFTTTYAISAHIITKVVTPNPVHGEVYSIQHYVTKFVSKLRQVGGFSLVLWFPPPINWPPRYNWNIVESGVKHHKPSQFDYPLFPLFLYICTWSFSYSLSFIINSTSRVINWPCRFQIQIHVHVYSQTTNFLMNISNFE